MVYVTAHEDTFKVGNTFSVQRFLSNDGLLFLFTYLIGSRIWITTVFEEGYLLLPLHNTSDGL